MNDDYSQIDRDKIELAYDRWCSLIGKNEYKSFWKFLKTDHIAAMSGWVGGYKVHNQGLTRLTQLLGGNHIAIIKAYQARNQRIKRRT